MATSVLLLVCAPYAAVAVGYLEARRRGEAPPAWARWLGLVAVVAHLVALVAVGRATGKSPFQTESQALSFLAFSLAGLYVVLERTSGVAAHGGGFHLLASAIAAAAVPGLAREVSAPAAARAPDVTFALHVGFALLGTAAIAAGGLLAIGYLGAYRRMKRHDVALLASEEGPSLSGLSHLARDASASGVLLLAPSLALGWNVLERSGGRSAWTVAELSMSALQLVLVVAAAFLWWRRPRRGAVAAWCNVIATALAVVSLGVVHPHVASGATGLGG